LAPVGLTPIPKLMRDSYRGQRFPKAYSEIDRERFRNFAEAARRSYGTLLAGMDEPPSIDMFSDDRFVGGIPVYFNRSCEAGHRFVSMEPNGDVHRCAVTKKLRLGNLLDGTFAPRAGAAPCNAASCYYFCEKYTRQARRTMPAEMAAASASLA
jgi:hypothetical protein